MNNSARFILTWLILQISAVARFAEVKAFESRDVFPVGRRQALLQKSKEINPASTYTASGWSNRPGTVLTPVTDGIYTADRPFYWNKIDVAARMTVVELPTKTGGKPDLWVHSPVGLDGPLKEAMAKLGTVKYVVSPNYEHLKFAPQWHLTYPNAEMWACPGLMERMPNIAWKGEFPYGIRPSLWKGAAPLKDGLNKVLPWDTNVLQTIHVNMEKNPFTDKAFFNEVIFYHAPSKTFITTDFFWNYPASEVPNSEFQRDDTWELAPRTEIPFTTRLWKFGMDRVYAPFYNNFMVTDQTAYRDICKHILNDWEIENVIPAHGDILRGKDAIKKVLTKFFKVKTEIDIRKTC